MRNKELQEKYKVLVVGQTPPPLGGQAVMIEKLLEARYERIEYFHVRMNFSKSMDEIGNFKASKIFHLIKIVISIWIKKFKTGATILYYPPAGNDLVPVLRDLILLCLTRFLFRKTIFHFHAVGVSDIYNELNPVLKYFYRRAYYNVDLAIKLSEKSFPDDIRLHCKKSVVVPNGITDNYSPKLEFYSKNELPTILFLNMLRKSKGVLTLLKALSLLKEDGIKFRAVFAGRFESKEYQKEVYDFVNKNDLRENVEFLGVVSGDDKWKLYASCDIFTLPSEWESFGLVVLEAMQFKKPVIVTNWPGVEQIVKDEENGYIIQIGHVEDLYKRLIKLLDDENLRKSMGTSGREIFLKTFTCAKFHDNIEKAILSL